MSYPGGYQQQQPQQPQGGYQPQQGGYQPQQQQPVGGYPSGGYSEPDNGTSPAVAVIAGVLALIGAAALIVTNVNLFDELGDASFGDLPSEFKTLIILRFAAALVLLVGSIFVFVRKLAGAFITVLGGLAGMAAVLIFPLLFDVDFGTYLEQVFKFSDTQSTFSAIALIASLLALILAILPPSLNYLKGSSASSSGYDGYQQPQQPGW